MKLSARLKLSVRSFRPPPTWLVGVWPVGDGRGLAYAGKAKAAAPAAAPSAARERHVARHIATSKGPIRDGSAGLATGAKPADRIRGFPSAVQRLTSDVCRPLLLLGEACPLGALPAPAERDATARRRTRSLFAPRRPSPGHCSPQQACTPPHALGAGARGLSERATQGRAGAGAG